MEIVFEEMSFGNPTEWYWDFGDGQTSFEQSPSHLYNEAGTYVVTLTITNDSCENTLAMEIPVEEQVMNTTDCFAFFIPIIGTPTINSVEFHDLSDENVVSWNWNFGDSTQSTEQNPTHEYAQSEIYTVTLTTTTSDNCTAMFGMEINMFDGSFQAIAYNGNQMTAINDVQQVIENMNIYPNPVKENLTLNFTSDKNLNYELEIITISGQVIKSQQINSEIGNNSIRVNVESLRQGVYFVKFGNQTLKFVK